MNRRWRQSAHNSPLILMATHHIGLRFTVLYIAPNQGCMATGHSLPKLAQLDQTGTGVILKIALRKLAKVGKLGVQPIEKVKATKTLIHRAIFARVAV